MRLFTVAALAYGDHPELISRCLDSFENLSGWEMVQEIRLGGNELSRRSREAIEARADLLCDKATTVLYTAEQHGRKYPMMRRMFFDARWPIRTPYVVWLDDDSYFTGRQPYIFHDLMDLMSRGHVAVGVYSRTHLRDGQDRWIARQPWAVKPVTPNQLVHFVPGGFWCAEFEFLRRHDYPFPEIRSQGGDYMLGMLAWQQDRSIADYRLGVAVNADESGKNGSSKRRGRHGEVLAQDYDGSPIDLSHQNMKVMRTIWPKKTSSS